MSPRRPLMVTSLLVLAVTVIEVTGLETSTPELQSLKKGPSGLRNVALNRPTSQSSDLGYGSTVYSSLAVDGNTDGAFSHGSCAHTDYVGFTRSWWQVDLQSRYDISLITIFNRVDCCPERLRDVDIFIYEEDPRVNAAAPARLCHHYGGEMPAGGNVITCDCGSLTSGRYVRIVNGGGQFLTLCEVQVFAGPSRLRNVALNRPTSQSSNSTHYDAKNVASSKAVDGNTDGALTHASCTHTHSSSNTRSWWQVDLQSRHNIALINIFNRVDCCPERLTDVDVYIYEEDPKLNAAAQGRLCRHFTGAMVAGGNVITCDAGFLPGRYVRIVNGASQFLTLCEVQVFAVALAPVP